MATTLETVGGAILFSKDVERMVKKGGVMFNTMENRQFFGFEGWETKGRPDVDVA